MQYTPYLYLCILHDFNFAVKCVPSCEVLQTLTEYDSLRQNSFVFIDTHGKRGCTMSLTNHVVIDQGMPGKYSLVFLQGCVGLKG